MNLLLDTHALLWWLDDPSLLSQPARDAIRDPQNIVHVSAVVAWEIAIKLAIGKHSVTGDIAQALAATRFRHLPITIDHAFAVQGLPLHHRDPFDRMLIAQATREGLTLVSRDSWVASYQVPLHTA